jgi:hypothetical protein
MKIFHCRVNHQSKAFAIPESLCQRLILIERGWTVNDFGVAYEKESSATRKRRALKKS